MVPEGGERGRNLIWRNGFPNLGKETNIQIQETQQGPNKINPKGYTPRHVINKMSEVKYKERNLKTAREN